MKLIYIKRVDIGESRGAVTPALEVELCDDRGPGFLVSGTEVAVAEFIRDVDPRPR
jgi:hypothetical protein